MNYWNTFFLKKNNIADDSKEKGIRKINFFNCTAIDFNVFSRSEFMSYKYCIFLIISSKYNWLNNCIFSYFLLNPKSLLLHFIVLT